MATYIQVEFVPRGKGSGAICRESSRIGSKGAFTFDISK